MLLEIMGSVEESAVDASLKHRFNWISGQERLRIQQRHLAAQQSTTPTQQIGCRTGVSIPVCPVSAELYPMVAKYVTQFASVLCHTCDNFATD